jgi:hypothetical protein
VILVGNKRPTFFLSRLRGLLLAPEREWGIIKDERSGGARLFRDFIVLPVAALSLFVLLARWATGDFSHALRWGVINFVACTAGCYLAFRATRRYLAREVPRVTPVALKLVVYTSTIYLLFRSLSMGFPPRNFLGELLAVCSLYAFYTLYTGLGRLTSMEAARGRSSCFIIGLLVTCLPYIFTRLLAILFSMPVN